MPTTSVGVHLPGLECGNFPLVRGTSMSKLKTVQDLAQGTITKHRAPGHLFGNVQCSYFMRMVYYEIYDFDNDVLF